ncbi:MAG TPA: tRNA pseudouridine(55) synthase TruB [Gemmatimonadaceae bacterium]|nr:tRNA pseudouridine(55) synthase TruB [Gemmatimonadaceae bacterium]
MGSATPDGLLLVDKPVGMTSHDVVAVARRALGTGRIGHAGTLDPFASGLLVLLVGRATRLLPYVDGEPKVYEATIRFGTQTDTDDHTGVVTREAALPSPATVEVAMGGLTGELLQMPPAYSAKKVGGERAYAAARRGEALELTPVPVLVHRWVTQGWRGAELDVEVTCRGGTYVRALARDLGAAADSAAHLTRLRRTRSGSFGVEDALNLEVLRAGPVELAPPLRAVAHLPAERCDELTVGRLARGIPVEARVAGERAALVDERGQLVAIGERRDGRWQPRVVLRDG